ncbi:hypothetical protein L2744_16205 [Shewanella profunda]|uniref:hypothetical protein n=1 Tax=Shewanella profunda TaxID=254793 RepID=UPI00200C2CF6|nr:hypothetical protein [Shewanella profunda]MCL1091115.1 hypothetical protein [Shewanella profunda]
MMWNWFRKVFGKTEQPKRKKVLVDIPFEQHSFSLDDFARSRPKFHADDNLSQDDVTPAEPDREVEAGNKSS